MGPIGSKVIEYRGQRSNLCVFFFDRFSPNLEGRWRAALDISLRGSFLSHLLIAGAIKKKVQISVRPSVRASVRPSTFTSKFGFLYINES